MDMKMKYRNLTISSKYLGNKNWNENQTGVGIDNWNNHIIYIYNNDTKKKCSFEFWNSNANGEIRTELDLLGAFDCFTSDARIAKDGSYDDFLQEFGYEEDKFSKKIYKMCCKSLEQFNRVVCLDLYEVINDLRENYGI